MKTETMMKRMSWVAAAAALLAAGCSDNEAKKFGYKGLDLEEADPMFFSTAPSVTNWVPARVLSVCENYDLSDGERKILADAGVITPGDELAEIPAGYAKQDDEPWFTTWTKANAAFGLTGVAGFLSHYDEDRKTWTTSEGYFSSYWPTKEEALAALGRLRATLAEGYGVKKFHEFDACWVAEYVRLRVMGVVGQKADGRWSCMLDFQDKNRPGCGQWEPVPEQQERRNQYVYAKAMKKWRAETKQLLDANHARLEKEMADAALPGFAEPLAWQTSDFPDGPRYVGVRAGVFTNALEEAWTAQLAEVKSALGLAPAEDAVGREEQGGAQFRWATMQDARYDVRLDMMFAPAAPEEPAPEGEGAPAEAASEAEPQGRWRLVCIERLPAGVALPKRPVLQK